MKYFLVAGEPSGDQHGADLIEAMFKRDEDAVIAAWGGDRMKSAGADLKAHYKDFTVMGFWEVFKNLGMLTTTLGICKQDIHIFQPDVLVLIDFPGFNLRLAKFAKKIGLKVVYYIPPKVWAWNEGRVRSLKKYVDRLLVIFPFEVDYYRQKNLHAEFVGNPTAEQVRRYKLQGNQLGKRNKIAILPGSRQQEVQSAIAIIAALSRFFPAYQFIVSKASQIDFYHFESLHNYPNIEVSEMATVELLSAVEYAVVTSGTATLEAALMKVPQVVVYRTSWLSYQVAKAVVNIRFISLVNILLDRPLVQELIQQEYTAEHIHKALLTIMNNPEEQKKISEGYSEILDVLEDLPASEIATQSIIALGCS